MLLIYLYFKQKLFNLSGVHDVLLQHCSILNTILEYSGTQCGTDAYIHQFFWMCHERNLSIHLLIVLGFLSYTLFFTTPQKKNLLVFGQVSVVAIQCFLFSQTTVN